MAMEDFRVDVIVGKGPGATAIPLEIPPFTVVGATTRAGLLPGPLRDRFGFTAQLDYYETDELHRIIDRSAGLLSIEVTDDGGREIAGRRAAHRASPTACCAASATSPRCAPTASSTETARARRWRCTRSTSSASTGSTRPSSRRCAQLRRRSGRRLDARGRRRRGARDRRGARRAVPRPAGLPGPHASRPGGHAAGLAASRTLPPRPRLGQLPLDDDSGRRQA